MNKKELNKLLIQLKKEENKNKNNSVKSLSVNGSFSDKGEFIVKGEIENIGNPIYSFCRSFYSILDSKEM